jgi:hypothetical protein
MEFSFLDGEINETSDPRKALQRAQSLWRNMRKIWAITKQDH